MAGNGKEKKGYEIDLSRILNTFDDCKDAKLTFKREERYYPELFVNTFSRAAHPALGGLLVKTRATLATTCEHYFNFLWKRRN